MRKIQVLELAQSSDVDQVPHRLHGDSRGQAWFLVFARRGMKNYVRCPRNSRNSSPRVDSGCGLVAMTSLFTLTNDRFGPPLRSFIRRAIGEYS